MTLIVQKYDDRPSLCVGTCVAPGLQSAPSRPVTESKAEALTAGKSHSPPESHTSFKTSATGTGDPDGNRLNSFVSEPLSVSSVRTKDQGNALWLPGWPATLKSDTTLTSDSSLSLHPQIKAVSLEECVMIKLAF